MTTSFPQAMKRCEAHAQCEQPSPAPSTVSADWPERLPANSQPPNANRQNRPRSVNRVATPNPQRPGNKTDLPSCANSHSARLTAKHVAVTPGLPTAFTMAARRTSRAAAKRAQQALGTSFCRVFSSSPCAASRLPCPSEHSSLFWSRCMAQPPGRSATNCSGLGLFWCKGRVGSCEGAHLLSIPSGQLNGQLNLGAGLCTPPSFTAAFGDSRSVGF